MKNGQESQKQSWGGGGVFVWGGKGPKQKKSQRANGAWIPVNPQKKRFFSCFGLWNGVVNINQSKNRFFPQRGPKVLLFIRKSQEKSGASPKQLKKKTNINPPPH